MLGEYQAPVQSRLKLQVDDLTDEAQILMLRTCRFRLQRKSAWTVEVPISLKLGPCCVQLDATVVPFYKQVCYGDVEVPDVFTAGDDNVIIPENRQINWGVRLEVGLRI